MRQCSPPLIAGSSGPKRALTARLTWPGGGTSGTGEWLGAGAATGGSDCNVGPLGAAGLAGVGTVIGGAAADGMSAGGR